MGNLHQKNLIQQYKHLVKGPILEVGGKDYGSTQQVRDFFPNENYLSVDMASGPGVDVALDLTQPLETVLAALPVKRFQTIINFSVLEHCANPFAMCNNLFELLEPGGVIFISAPFAWHMHAFPNDYWRFTPEGIKVLFPSLDFDTYPGCIGISEDQTLSLKESNFFLGFRGLRKEIQENKLSRFSAILIAICMKLHILDEIFSQRIIFLPTMVNMVGKKAEETPAHTAS